MDTTPFNPLNQNKVSWNIAQDIADQLSIILKKTTSLFLEGRKFEWYHALKAIRNRFINHEIANEERQLLDRIQRIVENNATRYSKLKRLSASVDYEDEAIALNKRAMVYYSKFCIAIEIYDRKIMKLLKKVGYLPAKENRFKVGF